MAGPEALAAPGWDIAGRENWVTDRDGYRTRSHWHRRDQWLSVCRLNL